MRGRSSPKLVSWIILHDPIWEISTCSLRNSLRRTRYRFTLYIVLVPLQSCLSRATSDQNISTHIRTRLEPRPSKPEREIHNGRTTIVITPSSYLQAYHASAPKFALIIPRGSRLWKQHRKLGVHAARDQCPGTTIRRAGRLHGRSRSQLHAPAADAREPDALQREFRQLPVRAEYERFLRGFPRGMARAEVSGDSADTMTGTDRRLV